MGGDFFGQFAQFRGLDHLVVDHADQEFLDGPPAEAVDQLLYRLHGDAAPAIDGPVVERPPPYFVADVAFLFDVFENGADGRLFEHPHAGHGFAAHIGRAFGMGPNVVHEGFFEGAQGLALLYAVWHSAITCSIYICQGQPGTWRCERVAGPQPLAL
jgi:hypothetical protein